MLKIALACSIVIGIGICFVTCNSQDPKTAKIQKSSAKFMARKLNHTRDIVAGLATENYDAISKNAQKLMTLSHEADWKVIQTTTYLDMSGEFRESAERLRDSALEKNIDGATLAYFEVTLNCVRCHKYVRKYPKLKKEEKGKKEKKAKQ